jgi:hypothetical protein
MKKVTELELGDECTKIILNTKGTNDDEVERSLVDFLHYIEHSIDANVPKDCDERLKYLHQITKQIKASEQIGASYMTMEERDRQIREDGMLEGEERFAKLTKVMLSEGKQEELLQAVGDITYREQLYLEYQI